MSKSKFFVYPHDMASEGCKNLAEALGGLRISHKNSRFRGKPEKVVVNWGFRGRNEEMEKCRVVNTPEAVYVCSNKKDFFETLGAVEDEAVKVRTPQFTSDKEVVKEWLSKGHTVCARKVLNGSNAEGLELFDGTQRFVEAPLYTMYVKKMDEYRIHVVNKKVISVQRKAIRKTGTTHNGGNAGYDPQRGIYVGDGKVVDHRIRNLANGYVFVRGDVDPPQDVLDQALRVFTTIPLDFGAVDVIYNNKHQKAFVLEVNTAPGLEGQTVTDYAEAIKGMF